MKKLKVLFGGVGLMAVAILTSCTITNNLTHIEDINGAEDTTLAVLTEADLVGKPRSLTVISSESNKDGKHTFYCNTFSGVKKLFTLNVGKDEEKTLSVDATINSGNSKLYIVQNGKIVKEIDFLNNQRISLSGLSGDLEVRIAGESAGVDVKIVELDA